MPQACLHHLVHTYTVYVVQEIPLTYLGKAGHGRCWGQSLAVDKHVHQGRLPHVRATHEHHLGQRSIACNRPQMQ